MNTFFTSDFGLYFFTFFGFFYLFSLMAFCPLIPAFWVDAFRRAVAFGMFFTTWALLCGAALFWNFFYFEHKFVLAHFIFTSFDNIGILLRVTHGAFLRLARLIGRSFGFGIEWDEHICLKWSWYFFIGGLGLFFFTECFFGVCENFLGQVVLVFVALSQVFDPLSTHETNAAM